MAAIQTINKKISLSFKETFFKLRFFLANLILKLLLKSTHKNSSNLKTLLLSLEAIKTKGFIKLEKYFSTHEIEYMDKISFLAFNELKKNNFKDEFIGYEKISGSVKIKNLSYKYKEFTKFSYDFLIITISFIFNFKFTKPTEIFNYSHDGSGDQSLAEGKCIENIAGIPHRDILHNSEHYLKAVILLGDVNGSNGPTKLIPNTNSLIKFGNKTEFLQNDKMIDDLIEKNGVKSFEGQKGDLIIFDATNIHWASKFNKGERKLIWLYF